MLAKLMLAGTIAAACAGTASATTWSGGTARDRAGIDALHRLDESATLTDKADELAKLWDKEAVRLQSGGAPEVGRVVIYQHDKAWERTNTSKSLAYKADVQDVRIVGDIAYEWGVFQATFTPRPGAAPVTIKGKQLRVMKRQPDKSWKFLRVMGVEDKS